MNEQQRLDAADYVLGTLDTDAGVALELALLTDRKLARPGSTAKCKRALIQLEPNRWMKATAPMCKAALSTWAAPGQLD